jgi:hypothetical protein
VIASVQLLVTVHGLVPLVGQVLVLVQQEPICDPETT